jgi:copper transporter 1
MAFRLNPQSLIGANSILGHMEMNCTMMPMSFDASINVGALLFEQWKVNTGWMYAIAILVMFFASILNQFLFFIVRKKINKDTGYENIDGGAGKSSNIGIAFWYIVKPTVFLFQNALSYLLMLAVMTFNVGIFVAIVVGNTVGWAIFSMRSNIVPEDCH